MQSVSESHISPKSKSYTLPPAFLSRRLVVLIGANGVGKTNCMRALSCVERNQVVYHFHNTCETAPVRNPGAISDHLRLRSDAGNLAAYLLHLKQKFSGHYQKIVRTVQLGLHPYAVAVLAAQLKVVSKRQQMIVSTQSVELVNELEADDIVIVSRRNGETIFERAEKGKLKSWLEDYSLGEIWKKNLLGGRPSK